MKRPASVLVLALVLACGAQAQSGSPPAPQYAIFDIYNTGNLQKELAAAGTQGLSVVALSDTAVVLKRHPAGRTYKVLGTTRDTTLVKELNEAGAEGFSVARFGVTTNGNDEWIVILEKQNDAKFSYQAIKGDDQAQSAIVAAQRTGARIAGVLGKAPGQFSMRVGSNPPPLIILEQRQGDATPSGPFEYRVVSTNKTSTMEKEIKEAAAAGFRVIGSGFMTVVMERDPKVPPPEYRLVAVARVPTFHREVAQAAADGFLTAAMPLSKTEVICVLSRPPGALQKFEGVVEELRPKTVEEQLRRLEGDGYVLDGLTGKFAVLHRPAR
jgi:hypothetical protein